MFAGLSVKLLQSPVWQGLMKLYWLKKWISSVMTTNKLLLRKQQCYYKVWEQKWILWWVCLFPGLKKYIRFSWVYFRLPCGVSYFNFLLGQLYTWCVLYSEHVNRKFSTSYDLTLNSSNRGQKEMLFKQSITAHQRQTHMEVWFSVFAPEANI